MNENLPTAPALAPVPVVKPASLQGLPVELKIRIVDQLDEIAQSEPERQFERYNARRIDRDFYAICSARRYKGVQILSDLPAFLSFCTIHLPIHGRHVRWLGISTRRPFIRSPDRKRDFQITFLRSERLQGLTGGSFDLAKQHDAVLAYAVSLCPNLRSVQVKLREVSVPLVGLAVYPHGDLSGDLLAAELAITYRFLQSSGSALTALALADFPVHILSELPPLDLPHLTFLALSHLCRPALHFAPFAHLPLTRLRTAGLCTSEVDELLDVLDSNAVPLEALTVDRFRHEDEECWDWDRHPDKLAAEDRLERWCQERGIKLTMGGGKGRADDAVTEYEPYPASDSGSWSDSPEGWLAEDALQAYYSSNPEYEARKGKVERRRDGMRKDRKRYERRKSK